jgi:hypothetical protein
VRQAARSLSAREHFSKRDVFDAAGITRADNESFKGVWSILRRRGELVMLGPRKYRYNPSHRPRGRKRVRIYRAMHIKGVFCAADIARLSDARLSYVRAVINALVDGGDLELTGKTGCVLYFRVRHAERFYLEKVK